MAHFAKSKYTLFSFLARNFLRLLFTRFTIFPYSFRPIRGEKLFRLFEKKSVFQIACKLILISLKYIVQWRGVLVIAKKILKKHNIKKSKKLSLFTFTIQIQQNFYYIPFSKISNDRHAATLIFFTLESGNSFFQFAWHIAK